MPADIILGFGEETPDRTSVLSSNGTPITLTGYTVVLEVYKSPAWKVTVACVPDPDQVTNRGKVSFPITALTGATGVWTARFIATNGAGKDIPCPDNGFLVVQVS